MFFTDKGNFLLEFDHFHPKTYNFASYEPYPSVVLACFSYGVQYGAGCYGHSPALGGAQHRVCF
jgi:hypothetical protein